MLLCRTIYNQQSMISLGWVPVWATCTSAFQNNSLKEKRVLKQCPWDTILENSAFSDKKDTILVPHQNRMRENRNFGKTATKYPVCLWYTLLILTRCRKVTCSSAGIHLAKCIVWSLSQVISWTDQVDCTYTQIVSTSIKLQWSITTPFSCTSFGTEDLVLLALGYDLIDRPGVLENYVPVNYHPLYQWPGKKWRD